MTAAGFPGVLGQIAFTTPYSTLTPTWVDVTADGRSFRTLRGRPGMFSQMQPGTADLVLRNTSGNYAADNPSGPYYGYIRPNRRTRIVATVGGTPYPLFTGYSDKFARGFDGVPTATVSSTDRFKILAKQRSTASYSDESAATRLTNLLSTSGPSGGAILSSTEYSINAGGFATRNVSTYDYIDFNALQALQDIENADGGMLFVDGSGVLQYQSVKYRQTGGATRALTSQARMGNDATSIPILPAVEPRVDQSLMANYIDVTDCNGTLAFAQDTTQQGIDGILDASLGGTLLLATDAQDRVNDDLALRKSPTERYEQVQVDLLTCTTAEQATILGLELSDRVTVAIIQAGLTSGTSREQWIEGISHDVQIVGDPSWTVTLLLSSCNGSATVIP
jgi:hypothetical protein